MIDNYIKWVSGVVISIFTLGFSEFWIWFHLNTQQDKGDNKQGTTRSCTLHPVEVLLPVPVLLWDTMSLVACVNTTVTPQINIKCLKTWWISISPKSITVSKTVESTTSSNISPVQGRGYSVWPYCTLLVWENRVRILAGTFRNIPKEPTCLL